MRTFVVVPARNESAHITQVLKGIKKYINKNNIIVIDNGSTDNTLELAVKEGVIAFTNNIPGKGISARQGCSLAEIYGAEAIILIDSDGQHNPDDIPKFIENLEYYDVVLSYRDLYNRSAPFKKQLGNHIINKLTQILYGKTICDSQSGFRGFKTSIFNKIFWKSNDYRMESEMLHGILINNVNFTQISIKTTYLDPGKGTSITDGIKIVWFILKKRFKK